MGLFKTMLLCLYFKCHASGLCSWSQGVMPGCGQPGFLRNKVPTSVSRYEQNPGTGQVRKPGGPSEN